MMAKREPSVNEVLAFARLLIPRIYLEHILNTLGSQMWFWWDLLHEVSHYAVKSDPYIEYWWNNSRPEKVPNMNWSCRNGVIIPDRYPDWNQNDHTPCEWGSRAWQREVLQFNGWINPPQIA